MATENIDFIHLIEWLDAEWDKNKWRSAAATNDKDVMLDLVIEYEHRNPSKNVKLDDFVYEIIEILLDIIGEEWKQRIESRMLNRIK